MGYMFIMMTAGLLLKLAAHFTKRLILKADETMRTAQKTAPIYMMRDSGPVSFENLSINKELQVKTV